jgi:hypothetical protein
MKTASVIDYKRKRKAPTIWDGDKLDPRVRSHILGTIKQHFPGAIGAFILGSITTKRYTKHSDVDVNVVMPKTVEMDPYRTIAKAINKSKPRFPGSPHVITFFMTHPADKKDAIQKTTGAYDLVSDQWLKRPDDLGADPKSMEGAFQGQIKDVDIAIGELNRDVRDIRLIMDTFREVPDTEKQKILVDLEEKKEEIEEDLKAITEEYDEFHKARVASFEKEVEADGPAAAKKHLLNQTLPGNVVFKMMERYGYRDLLERLRDIYKAMPGVAQ